MAEISIFKSEKYSAGFLFWSFVVRISLARAIKLANRFVWDLAKVHLW
jgi:hypothetical protein